MMYITFSEIDYFISIRFDLLSSEMHLYNERETYQDNVDIIIKYNLYYDPENIITISTTLADEKIIRDMNYFEYRYPLDVIPNTRYQLTVEVYENSILLGQATDNSITTYCANPSFLSIRKRPEGDHIFFHKQDELYTDKYYLGFQWDDAEYTGEYTNWRYIYPNEITNNYFYSLEENILPINIPDSARNETYYFLFAYKDDVFARPYYVEQVSNRRDLEFPEYTISNEGIIAFDTTNNFFSQFFYRYKYILVEYEKIDQSSSYLYTKYERDFFTDVIFNDVNSHKYLYCSYTDTDVLVYDFDAEGEITIVKKWTKQNINIKVLFNTGVDSEMRTTINNYINEWISIIESEINLTFTFVSSDEDVLLEFGNDKELGYFEQRVLNYDEYKMNIMTYSIFYALLHKKDYDLYTNVYPSGEIYGANCKISIDDSLRLMSLKTKIFKNLTKIIGLNYEVLYEQNSILSYNPSNVDTLTDLDIKALNLLYNEDILIGESKVEVSNKINSKNVIRIPFYGKSEYEKSICYGSLQFLNLNESYRMRLWATGLKTEEEITYSGLYRTTETCSFKTNWQNISISEELPIGYLYVTNALYCTNILITIDLNKSDEGLIKENFTLFRLEYYKKNEPYNIMNDFRVLDDNKSAYSYKISFSYHNLEPNTEYYLKYYVYYSNQLYYTKEFNITTDPDNPQYYEISERPEGTYWTFQKRELTGADQYYWDIKVTGVGYDEYTQYGYIDPSIHNTTYIHNSNNMIYPYDDYGFDNDDVMYRVIPILESNWGTQVWLYHRNVARLTVPNFSLSQTGDVNIDLTGYVFHEQIKTMDSIIVEYEKVNQESSYLYTKDERDFFMDVVFNNASSHIYFINEYDYASTRVDNFIDEATEQKLIKWNKSEISVDIIYHSWYRDDNRYYLDEFEFTDAYYEFDDYLLNQFGINFNRHSPQEVYDLVIEVGTKSELNLDEDIKICTESVFKDNTWGWDFFDKYEGYIDITHNESGEITHVHIKIPIDGYFRPISIRQNTFKYLFKALGLRFEQYYNKNSFTSYFPPEINSIELTGIDNKAMQLLYGEDLIAGTSRSGVSKTINSKSINFTNTTSLHLNDLELNEQYRVRIWAIGRAWNGGWTENIWTDGEVPVCSRKSEWQIITYTGSDIPQPWIWLGLNDSGQPFNLTADQWNGFTNRINQFREYKGLSQILFSIAYVGEPLTSSMFLEASNALYEMTTSVASECLNIQSGDAIYRWYFDNLSASMGYIT